MPSKILLFLLLLPYGGYAQNYSLKILEQPYRELNDASILCKDTIPKRAYFTLDEPLHVLQEEIDSIFIMDFKTIHIGFGKKKSKEIDLFFPLSCPIKKVKNDSVGFSISYKIEGEVGKRKVTIQWKGVRPDYTYSEFDAINLQVIIDEEHNTVSYAYGKVLPFIELILSVWINDRQLSLYFVDDMKGYHDAKYKVNYIRKDIFAPHLMQLNTAYFTGGQFDENFITSKTPYSLDDVEIKEGLVFEMGEKTILGAYNLQYSSISIYPNPAFQTLYINTENVDIDSIIVLDLTGKIVLRGKSTDEIPVDILQPGLYLISFFKQNRKIKTLSFIKK
jgi:hypothetical protein